ncbi:hypothetical protein [Paraburkholderia acidiphila]|uniref:Uncharacterized protein n=1 Tax=Paraburkholderia acidiphila TaxID=2571747 RepID=A0A7Z2J8P7_9BURK|nr:hypothetical protein [Paraburkholderia acidiphila]QGZ54848.1 hypothetical protein FAZ97_07900 [Paraburkholderia acidiphila]
MTGKGTGAAGSQQDAGHLRLVPILYEQQTLRATSMKKRWIVSSLAVFLATIYFTAVEATVPEEAFTSCAPAMHDDQPLPFLSNDDLDRCMLSKGYAYAGTALANSCSASRSASCYHKVLSRRDL